MKILRKYYMRGGARRLVLKMRSRATLVLYGRQYGYIPYGILPRAKP